MNILGIHYGHNATVAFMQNGKLVFAMSEERFNRLKNSNGFPVQSLAHLYQNHIRPDQIDFAVLFQKDIAGYLELKNHGFKSVRNFGIGNVNFNRKYSLRSHLLSKISWYSRLRTLAGSWRRAIRERTLQQESLDYFARVLQLPKEKIIFSKHHASHAYACCFNLPTEQQTLVFTMDGEGDGESSTVNIWDGNSLNTISTNPISVSIGYFFTEITKYLGMTPNEHEFKVMGLAPYAKQQRARALYEQFKDWLVLDHQLRFRSKFDFRRLEYRLIEVLYGQRFDTVAAFAQIFLEEKVLDWVRQWIAKTGIRTVALSGGVFMSVKLNQKILELPEVEDLFVMPSAADESTAIGASFYGGLEFCRGRNQAFLPTPIDTLYLGNEYTHEDITDFLKLAGARNDFVVQEFPDDTSLAKKVAQLLAENKVVARFFGRAEWGARALGNRSILANPSSQETVRIINEMIKNRDFWMPFAASILEEDKDSYLRIGKKMPAPYMAITFNATKLGAEKLKAAIHPYDFTCRPQLVSKHQAPVYHALISEFKRLTGIGAVLNTSFNLHGEPNVESPGDALRTFAESGLHHLALGKYLLSKK